MLSQPATDPTIRRYAFIKLLLLCSLLAGCGSADVGDNFNLDGPDNLELPENPELLENPEVLENIQPTAPEDTGAAPENTDNSSLSEPVDPSTPVGECDISTGDTDAGAELEPALTALQQHLEGSDTLSTDQLDALTLTIQNTGNELTFSAVLIEQAFATVALYDEIYDPLFLNESTRGRIDRTSGQADDAVHYTLIALQQSIIDHAYSQRNAQRYRSTIEGQGFATAEFFPGAIPDNTPRTVAYTVELNASNNPSLSHRPYGAFDADSRRPTGAYAPAGAIVEVNVPASMVGTGYKVRVGAHSWDLSNKNTITRLDRVSILYDIKCSTTLVANPLGGGIYIEVPFQADAGIVSVQFDNAVRSPYFAARGSIAHTSNSEWTQEKSHAAPWADLESDHFMIQVPSSWLDEITDPAELMAEWDSAMQSILDLYGITETHKTMLYVQIDRTFRGTANFPGYPMSNYPYNPIDPNPNNGARSFLRGPDEVGYVTFHELGHQLLFTKFRGEVESVVHLPYVNFMNQVFGVDLDTALSRSSFRSPNVNLDQAFMNWAVRPNFRQGLEMRTARPNSEKLYQRRGYAHYILIARIFGWEALQRFWASEHLDYANGIDYNRNSNGQGDVDSRILRMSQAAGVDLRPLLHVWGNHPENFDELASSIQTEGLPSSAQIFDELQRYKSLIPMTNAQFEAHARTFYPMLRANTNVEAFEGWYHETAATWSESDGNASQQALQDIVDLYFPTGRPGEVRVPVDVPPLDADLPISPATEATPLTPVVITNDPIDTDHHAVP